MTFCNQCQKDLTREDLFIVRVARRPPDEMGFPITLFNRPYCQKHAEEIARILCGATLIARRKNGENN